MKLDIKGYMRIIFQDSMLHANSLFFNGRAKTKLAVLAFLYCGEFVKNSNPLTFVRQSIRVFATKWINFVINVGL